MLEKISTCHNNHKNSLTTNIKKHTASGYSLLTHCSFDLTKNKLDSYRGKVFVRILEHTTKIINYEKKGIIPLTDEENKCYKKQKICYICKKGFSTDDDNKKYHKVRDHCPYTGKCRGAAHSICNLKVTCATKIFFAMK